MYLTTVTIIIVAVGDIRSKFASALSLQIVLLKYSNRPDRLIADLQGYPHHGQSINWLILFNKNIKNSRLKTTNLSVKHSHIHSNS